jgi:outer membrane protein OmpA-like peptidoglycan-associated protein
MYVRLREGVAQYLNAIDLDRVAHLNHSYAHALGQQSAPTARAGTTTSKCDVVGNPVILDTFDVGDYRLKPRHYDLLLELAAQVVNKASSAGGLLLLIDGHADDAGQPFMNIGLSFNRALEVKNFLAEVIAYNSKNLVSVPLRIKGSGERSPIRGAPKSKNRRVEVRLCRLPSPTLPSVPRQSHGAAIPTSGLGRNSQSLPQCPGGTQPAQNYKPPFTLAESRITEQEALQVFVILCGPSPWQQYLRSNLNAHLQDLPAQRPIRIVIDLDQRYRAVFGAPPPADVQGFVDRRNATIYLREFPAGNVGRSLMGLALHEAVHLFSHPPGRSNQLRATAYDFLGVGLLEGLTQVITEDIQTAQGIRPLRDRWQAFKEYIPVARRVIQIFTLAVVGDAYFKGDVTKLLRVIEQRWTHASFRKVKMLIDQKQTKQALQLIDSLEKAYLIRPKPKVHEFRWIFR